MNDAATPKVRARFAVRHDDGHARCGWCGVDPLYVAYHDTEWGVPERDSRALFEKFILDGFQAGLSWITILRKRPAFRAAFDGFRPEIMARYGPEKIEALMADAGIVRNRSKIESAVRSAQAYLDIEEKQGFARFVWDFVDGRPKQNRVRTLDEIPAQSEESRKLSKALKAKGFNFVGPTIVYAAMQATGMVNDHLAGCFRCEDCARLSDL
jgi:DNA-3-methyladenine glycosylase I